MRWSFSYLLSSLALSGATFGAIALSGAPRDEPVHSAVDGTNQLEFASTHTDAPDGCALAGGARPGQGRGAAG